MTALVEDVDDRFAGIDIDSLLNGQRRPLSFERRKALYEAPEFIQRLNGEETVMEGQSLCIECKIRGFPVPYLRWFKDDEEIVDHPRIHVESDGIGGYYLMIDHVTRGDEAAYRCRAENVEGACSSFFFLSVKGKPRRRETIPSWRTVSFPPMFSTIMERVEEEEKLGKEFEELPPSPLTEFYYALTLKSRCSWPAFLGDWAFVNNCHPYRRHSSNSEDDDDVYTEEDDEEEDGNFDAFFITNGDICDKIKYHNSSKAHFVAKRSSRKSTAKAKVKKQKLGNKANRDEEKGNHFIDKGYVFENKNEKNKCNTENDLEINRIQKAMMLETESMQHGQSAMKEEVKRATKEEMTMPSVTFSKDIKDSDATPLNENIIHKETNMRTAETVDSQWRNQDWIEANKNVSVAASKEKPTEYVYQSSKQALPTLQQENKDNYGGRGNSTTPQLLFGNLEEGRESSRERISQTLASTAGEQCFRKIAGSDTQNNNEHLDLNTKASPRTDKVPIALRIYNFDTPENGPVTKKNEILQSLNSQIERKETSPFRPNESNAERQPTQEKSRQTTDANADIKTGNRLSVGTENKMGSYSHYRKPSAEGEYRTNQLRQSRYRDSSGQSRQVSGQDRLEELRQQEVKRMEELKQEELKRMEELRQETKTNTYAYKRTRILYEDVRERERKQIEGLRRKEQFLREELQQKEQQQLQDLRKREASLVEEMKSKEPIISDTLSGYKQEQREESLVKEREELRLKEQNQMEEFKERESLQKDEFVLQEYMRIEDHKAYERNLINGMKLKDGSYYEQFNQQAENELQKQEEEKEERKKMKETEMRIHAKKEQIRKEQLRRQHEEEIQKRLKKEQEAKRQRILMQDIAKDNKFMKNLHNRSLSFRQGNVTTTGDIFSHLSFSNTQTKPRLDFRVKCMEDADLSTTKLQDCTTSFRNSFTNSLDRSSRKASQYGTKTKSDGLFNQSHSVSEKLSYLRETDKENDSRYTNTTFNTRYTEGSSLSLDKDLSSPSSYKYSKPLNQSKVQKPLSFASFFAIEESRVAKPSLRTHEDLFKLAESIAAKRERFHEYLSHGSFDDNESVVPVQKENITSRQEGPAADNQGVHIRKQVSDLSNDPWRTGHSHHLNGNDHSANESDPDDKNKVQSSPSPSASNPADGTTCEPSAIQIRPFVYNSARTTARSK
ncbi:hypothetical protein BsWGS_14104 [Bradybaena similaris]